MLIRAADVTDEAKLACISLAAKAVWGYSATQLSAWREDLSPAVASMLSRPTFVAEIGGEAAGYYQLVVRERNADLEHLWVHPACMRQGIGRALVAHALEFAAAHGIDVLLIDSDPNAESFYLACGATRAGLSPAPIDGQPERFRPQMVLSVAQYFHRASAVQDERWEEKLSVEDSCSDGGGLCEKILEPVPD